MPCIYIYIYISKKSKRVSKNPNNIYVIKKIKTKNVPWFWSGSLEHRCTQGGPDSKNQQEFQGPSTFPKTLPENTKSQRISFDLKTQKKKKKHPEAGTPWKMNKNPEKRIGSEDVSKGSQITSCWSSTGYNNIQEHNPKIISIYL